MRNTSAHARAKARRGFTLIEVLVVVAIIALLISILLPSLAVARSTAQMTACLAHMKQLATACYAYSSANRGYMPGVREKSNWLGRHNRTTANDVRAAQPMDGTLYRYVGRNRHVYLCPTDKPNPEHTVETARQPKEYFFSYTLSMSMVFAKPENYSGAHYRQFDFNNQNHNTSKGQMLLPMEGTPLLMEESPITLERMTTPVYEDYFLTQHNSGIFTPDDFFAARHMAARGGKESRAAVGYLDGHASSLGMPCPRVKPASDAERNQYFLGKSMCVRTKNGRYINAEAYSLSDVNSEKAADIGQMVDNTVTKGYDHR